MLPATRNSRTGFSRTHVVRALDFQLTVIIIIIATLGLSAPLLFPFACVMSITAATRALTGRQFRYPVTLKHLRPAATALGTGVRDNLDLIILALAVGRD